MSPVDREPNGGPLNPEDLAELKCWAEDAAVERNWSYTDRLWIRGTVLKLIEEFERLKPQVQELEDEVEDLGYEILEANERD